jgi:hypothetical protein
MEIILYNKYISGCSSVVEHNLAKVVVEGSNPFARSFLMIIFKHEEHTSSS